MKKQLLFLLFSVLTLTSCTFTENISINENGTGKFSIVVDGSSLMAMAGDQLGSQMGAEAAKDIDTTFTFKQILEAKKDSISQLSPEVQKELKKLENFVVMTKMNTSKNEFLMTLATDFKNVNELQDMMQTVNALQKLDKNSESATALPFPTDFGNNNSTLSYAYNGNKFTRKATIDFQKVKEETEDTSAEMMNMVFASSQYIVKYNFPKKIKKVSNTNALFSEDRKTVTVQYSFTDYMENPEKLNFEVEFEK